MNTALFSRSILVSVASCAALLASSLPAVAAANDYFLKFDGINGGSTIKGHEKWTDISSFSWGVTNSGGSSGSGAGVGKAVFSDFSWTQALDSSYIPLFADISTGKHIKSAVVDFMSGGAKPINYFKMTFEDVSLTKIDLSASSGSSPLMEGSFAYGKVTFDYWTQKADGSRGDKTTAWYDLKERVGSPVPMASVFALGLMGPQVAVVPEPESYAMLLAGLGILGAVARRRRQVS